MASPTRNVRRRPTPAKHGRERVPLWGGQPVEVIEHRYAQLMETAYGSSISDSTPHRVRDAPAGDSMGQVTQQLALADARVSAQNRDAACAGHHVGQKTVKRFALATASEECRTARTCFSSQRRPPLCRSGRLRARAPQLRTCGATIVEADLASSVASVGGIALWTTTPSHTERILRRDSYLILCASRALSTREEPAVLGQRSAKLPARADPELGEHLAQVPLDRARAEEELGADLGIREPVAGEPGDLLLLRSELSRVSALRLRIFSPVAISSRRARSANASIPIATNMSWAIRSCSRASPRRPSRRSHSP